MRVYTNIIFLLIFGVNFGQSSYKSILEDIDENKVTYTEIAQQIWSYAEMGYQEEHSSALLQKTLAEQGFEVEKGVAEIPTPREP